MYQVPVAVPEIVRLVARQRGTTGKERKVTVTVIARNAGKAIFKGLKPVPARAVISLSNKLQGCPYTIHLTPAIAHHLRSTICCEATSKTMNRCICEILSSKYTWVLCPMNGARVHIVPQALQTPLHVA
eukprot:6195396-Pleurochrysis_carterae.AAC.4